jgi:hypothetical protein
MMDAGQDIMQWGIGRQKVMHVAGRNQPQSQAVRQLAQPYVQLAVAALVMPLHFQ